MPFLTHETINVATLKLQNFYYCKALHIVSIHLHFRQHCVVVCLGANKSLMIKLRMSAAWEFSGDYAKIGQLKVE